MAKSDLLTTKVIRNRLTRTVKELVDAFDTSTGHSHDGSDSASLSATGNTLDQAYDQGGAGSGRAITVNDGAVTMTKNDAGTENVLELDASPSAGAAGAALSLTSGASATTASLIIANSGSGADILGTSSTWNVDAAGVGSFTNAVLLEGTVPAASLAYVARDNTGDLTVNAITGKEVLLAIAGTDVVTVAGAAVTIAQALTVSAGGLTVTGNSTFNNNLTITGSLTFGGSLTINETLTVDELILDTDGSAPGASNAYVVSDNTGDLTVNALSGKTFNIAIAGTDELVVSASAVDFKGNDVDNLGYLELNATTNPATGDAVWLSHDNTGDLTVNVRNGKALHIAENGTDEYNFSDTEFELASGNDIQFLGDDGILDSAANELIKFEAVGSATTYLNLKNANGAAIELEVFGAADKGFLFKNDQNETMFSMVPVASGDTWLQVTSAVGASNGVILAAAGVVDRGFVFHNAAAEPIFQIDVTGSAPVNWLTLDAADTGGQVVFANDGEADIGMLFNAKDDEEMLSLKAATAAVTYVEITSAASGVAGPSIKALGETNTNLLLIPDGTGAVNIAPGTAGSKTSPSLIFAGAVAGLDTGLFADVADELGITVGGAQAMYFGAAQEVYLGTGISTTFTGPGGALIFDDIAAPGGTSTNQAMIYGYSSGGNSIMAQRQEDGTAADL